MLKKFLKEHILLTDGAMGTYYSFLSGRGTTLSEPANKTEPEIISRIHKEYIAAGAKLIRTNTFSVNTVALKITGKEAKELLTRGFDIANEAVKGQDVFIGADIGPLPETTENRIERDREEVLDEYKFLAGTFLDAGAEVFIFETFSSTEYLKETARYIKEKKNDAFILVQFALMPDGFTRKGIGVDKIIEQVKNAGEIDAFGFNCGTGPKPLYNTIKNLDFSQDIISVLPNAGFPEIINERTVYVQNPEYFSEVMLDIKKLGARIIGGCCGTTPQHIKKVAEKLGGESAGGILAPAEPKKKMPELGDKKTCCGLKKSKYLVAVELAPPCDWEIEKVLGSARALKRTGLVDIITVPDSPLGKTRLNSIIAAACIKRETGLDAMPHICCRDRNIIALKSDLLGAYAEGIRNVLVVTGDPIPCSEKSETKSVFDLNSLKLMKLISTMNREQFAKEPLKICGGLNLNVDRKDIQVGRMHQKAEAGAEIFLTQPIYGQDVIDYLPQIIRRDGEKILGGVMPVVSLRNAQFLNNEIPGIRIPDEQVNCFTHDMTRENAESAGLEIAVNIVGKIKNYVDGFYFITPFNRVNIIIKILERTFHVT